MEESKLIKTQKIISEPKQISHSDFFIRDPKEVLRKLLLLKNSLKSELLFVTGIFLTKNLIQILTAL